MFKLIGILFFLLFLESTAYGYIDPGAGSVLIQLVLGGFGGLLVVVRLYWNDIKSSLSRFSVRKIQKKSSFSEKEPSPIDSITK